MGLDLQVAVGGPQPAGDRLGILVAVVDRCLLEGEEVEIGEGLGLLDRAQDPVELQPEVKVPGAESEPRRGCAGYDNKGNKVVGLT